MQGGLSWVVPQLTSPKDSASAYAHRQFPESFDPALDGEEFQRTYVHVAERSEKGGLECYACHSSWQPNCLSCHIKMDVTKPKQEIWWGDDDVEDTFFQLFSFTRSPFLLGHAGDVEKNKIAPHRSTMQVHVSIVADSVQIAESAMFSTQGSLSSMSSNPYYPHTVRTTETKSCARCHTLVDEADRIGNDHLITETTGQGTGRYQNIGDWAVVSSSAGMELLDVKKEAKGDVTFPGFDFFDGNADGQKRRKVLFNSGPASDVVVNRGVSFQDGNGDPYDLAIIASERGVSIVDFFGRDNVGYPPTELARLDTFGPVRSVDTVEAAASQSSRFILATDEEIAVLDYRSALDFAKTARLIDADAGNDPVNDQPLPDAGPDALRQGVALVGSLPHGKDAPTKVRLHGRFAVLAHAGGISVFELGLSDSLAEIDPGAPLSELVTFATQHPALDVTTHGRFAYVATGAGGVEIFDIGPVVMNTLFDGLSTAPAAMALVGDVTADSRGVAMWGSRLLVADGENGLRILDVSTPADPRLEQTLQNLGGAVALDNATAVVLAEVPTRTFAIVANGAQVHAINITPTVDFRRQLQAADVDPAGFRGLRLSHERSDPLTPYDPKNATRQVFTFPTDGNVTSIARGLAFDNIEDKGGRRLRDGWSIGAAPLNERMIARMRNVRVREAPGYKDIRGDGLGCVVREGDETRVSPDPENPDRCLPPQ